MAVSGKGEAMWFRGGVVFSTGMSKGMFLGWDCPCCCAVALLCCCAVLQFCSRAVVRSRRSTRFVVADTPQPSSSRSKLPSSSRGSPTHLVLSTRSSSEHQRSTPSPRPLTLPRHPLKSNRSPVPPVYPPLAPPDPPPLPLPPLPRSVWTRRPRSRSSQRYPPSSVPHHPPATQSWATPTPRISARSWSVKEGRW